MRARLLLAAVMVLGSAYVVAHSSDPFDDDAGRAVLRAAVSGFIQPGYARFHREAKVTQDAVTSLCESPSADSLDGTRSAFGTLVEAWSRIEIIRFGPVVTGNRLERIYFFPDRRSIGLRQVQRLLAKGDPAELEPKKFAQKSVAVQGLGALEYLLFGTGAEALEQGDAYRCQFALAVAGRIEATAGELSAAWSAPDGIATHLADPRQSRSDYRTVDESLRALLGILIHSTEFIAEQRIRPFAGDTAEAARPKRAAFWRSGLTRRSLHANFDGMEELFKLSGMVELLPPGTGVDERLVEFEFANVRRALDTSSLPLPDAAADSAERKSVLYLLIVTRAIRMLFAQRMAAGLGLSAGFSSLDGD